MLSTKPDVVEGWLARSPAERPPRLTFAVPSAIERPSGLELSVLGDDVRVRMPALGQEPTLLELAKMIDALPARFGTVRMEATPWLAPTDAERRLLTRALSRPRTVV